MVTDRTRDDVWAEMLDVARLVRYYEALSDRYRRYGVWLRVALLVSMGGGFWAVLGAFPLWAQLGAGLAVSVIAILDLVMNFSKKAAVAHTITLECGLLEKEWRDLWAYVENEDADETEARDWNRRLSGRLEEIIGWAGHADIGGDDKLNRKCADSAYAVMARQYGVHYAG